MTTFLPGALILKEGRALAFIWLGAAVTMVAAARSGESLLALFAFVLGAAALGVFSIGHEYAHRTLTMLLAQPLTRSRLLLSKVVVLASLLVLLSIIAAVVLLRADGIERVFGEGTIGARWRLAVVVLTPLLGLCVAPWLTMVCRSAMGGLVFTLAVPASLWIAGQIARAVTTNFDAARNQYAVVDRLQLVVDRLEYEPALTLMIVGVLIVSLVAVVHGCALFLGLEALDAPRDLLPATRPAATPGGAATESRARGRSGSLTRSPLAQLVRKEVRLQSLAFAVAGLYALGWIAMRLARMDLSIAGQSFQAITAMYGVFIALLVVAISGAEERAMGVTDWQILQPYAFWKQWVTKVVTASVLALLLGLVLPTLLEAWFPLIAGSGSVGPRAYFMAFPEFLTKPAAVIVLVTLLSLYASSLCVGGLRALLVALPFVFGLAAIYRYLSYATFSLENRMLTDTYGPLFANGKPWWQRLPTASSSDFITAAYFARWFSIALVVGFFVVILALSLRNSRSSERGLTIARAQVPWVVTYVALAAVCARGVPALLQWWLFTH